MKKNIYFVTSNLGKLQECKKIIPDLEQIDIDLPEIQELDPHKVIKEKLECAYSRLKKPVLVEDTSVFLECLNGFPGPLIKWFIQSMGLEKVVELVNKFENQNVYALTIFGYKDSNESPIFFEGKLSGIFVPPSGEDGFGWDSIFIPEGYTKTFAELSPEEKEAISMRTIALQKFEKYIV